MKKIITFLVLILMIFGCAPKLSSSFTKEGYTTNTYEKIAVVAISNDLSARAAFESATVKLLKDNGFNAIEGINIFPQNMSKSKMDSYNLIKIIKDNNLDGIITMSLVDTKEGERYVQGNTYTVPSGYYRVGRYISRRYLVLEEPGYYESTKSYVIEGILYDLKGDLNGKEDNWVWIGSSDLVNPSSLKSAASNFAKQIVNELVKKEIVISK